MAQVLDENAKTNRILKISSIIMFVLLIPFIAIIVFSTMVTLSAKNNNKVPNLFGNYAVTIDVDYSGNKYKKGDIVLVVKKDTKDIPVNEENKYVAFYEYLEEGSEKDFSDIVIGIPTEKTVQNDPASSDYNKVFFTFYNQSKGEWQEIREDFVIGTVESQNGFFEKLLVFTATNGGTIVLAILPGLVLIVLLAICIGMIRKLKRLKNGPRQVKFQNAEEVIADEQNIEKEKSKKDINIEELLGQDISSKKQVDKTEPTKKAPSVPKKPPVKNTAPVENSVKPKLPPKTPPMPKAPAMPKVESQQKTPAMPKVPTPPKAPPKAPAQPNKPKLPPKAPPKPPVQPK